MYENGSIRENLDAKNVIHQEVMSDRCHNENIEKTLIIQHDWHILLKETIAMFYVGIQEEIGEKTKFYDIQATKMIDEYGFSVLPDEQGSSRHIADFGEILLDDNQNLHITYKGMTTIFVSPTTEVELNGLLTAPKTFDIGRNARTFLAADSTGNLTLSACHNGKLVLNLNGHASDVTKCLYFPSGYLALSAGADMTVRVWNLENGSCEKMLKGHNRGVSGIGILGSGREILSCSLSGSVYKWSVSRGKINRKWRFDAGSCLDLAVAADSSRFAVISEKNKLTVIDCFGNKNRHDINLPSVPSCLCFSNSTIDTPSQASNLIFVGFHTGQVDAYNVVEQKLVGTISANRGGVTCVKYFLNRLLVAYADGRVSAYPIPTMPVPTNGKTNIICAEYELTGPDCDPIHDITVRKNVVYTCCRDKLIRSYSVNWNL